MDVPFYFEKSKYYDYTQTSMLVGMGASLTDRLMFNENMGINFIASFIIPMSMTAMIEKPSYEIFEAQYQFLSYIFGTGLGFTYKHNIFLFDTNFNIHYFSMENSFAEYNNFALGFSVTPAFLIPLIYKNTPCFEIGLRLGMDLYSDSAIKLLIENKTIMKCVKYCFPY
jgi:hypothetical protein